MYMAANAFTHPMSMGGDAIPHGRQQYRTPRCQWDLRFSVRQHFPPFRQGSAPHVSAATVVPVPIVRPPSADVRVVAAASILKTGMPIIRATPRFCTWPFSAGLNRSTYLHEKAPRRREYSNTSQPPWSTPLLTSLILLAFRSRPLSVSEIFHSRSATAPSEKVMRSKKVSAALANIPAETISNSLDQSPNRPRTHPRQRLCPPRHRIATSIAADTVMTPIAPFLSDISCSHG